MKTYRLFMESVDRTEQRAAAQERAKERSALAREVAQERRAGMRAKAEAARAAALEAAMQKLSPSPKQWGIGAFSIPNEVIKWKK